MEHTFTPLVFLVLMTPPLVALKRWINRHLQGLGFLIWGDSDMGTLLYFLTLLPGIVVHELSHWLTAKLLGVKTGKISIWPSHKAQGRIRLGSVQVARVDPLRSSLIGLAPLISGAAIIFLIGDQALGLSQPIETLFSANWGGLRASLASYSLASDFWIWLYIIFAISNAMLPSESDRGAWWPMLGIVVFISVLGYVSGAVTSVPPAFISALLDVVRYLAYAFTLTVIVDAVFMVFIGITEKILERLKGVRVDYR